MSKLVQYRDIEKNIKELQARLESLTQDDRLNKELEFEKKFNMLLEEYEIDKKAALKVLAPELIQPAATPGSAAPRQRRERKVKIYKNPHNGETVETKGGNHKTLKAWKQEYGADVVESWLQS